MVVVAASISGNRVSMTSRGLRWISSNRIRMPTIVMPTIAKKKQRVRFTQAEEDFLREGVVKYDGDATKWRKILDDPNFHFHESRNTVDLKDKWRNILKKDGAEEAD